MKFGYCWVAVAVAALLCATGVAGDGASASGKKVITAPQRDVLLRHGREGLDLTSAEARFEFSSPELDACGVAPINGSCNTTTCPQMCATGSTCCTAAQICCNAANGTESSCMSGGDACCDDGGYCRDSECCGLGCMPTGSTCCGVTYCDNLTPYCVGGECCSTEDCADEPAVKNVVLLVIASTFGCFVLSVILYTMSPWYTGGGGGGYSSSRRSGYRPIDSRPGRRGGGGGHSRPSRAPQHRAVGRRR